MQSTFGYIVDPILQCKWSKSRFKSSSTVICVPFVTHGYTIKGRLSFNFHYFYFYSFVWFSLDLTHLCTTLNTVFRNSCPFARNPATTHSKNVISKCGADTRFYAQFRRQCLHFRKVQAIELFGIVRSYIALVHTIFDQYVHCARTMPNG